MKYLAPFLFTILFVNSLYAQNQNMTDISLFWEDNTEQVHSIESQSGNLYQEVGHHGPAVENEWLGLRLYFDHKVAIDVYNKATPQLELAGARWYPTAEQEEKGWGSDQYK